MSLGREFLRAMVRKAGYIVAAALLGLLAMAFTGKAQAQNVCPFEEPRPCDQGKAHDECKKRVKQWLADMGNPQGVNASCVHAPIPGTSSGSYQAQAAGHGGFGSYHYGGTCAGRSNLSGGYVQGSSSPRYACYQGCQYKPASEAGIVKVDFAGTGAGWTASSTGWEPTGMICATNDREGLPNNSEECIPIEGQTVCKRQDGKLCYSANPSSRHCWASGETGQRTHSNQVQVRNEGSQPQPPNIGQPTQPTSAPPITTTVTNITNSSTTTTTTTVSNHSTVNGSPAGTSNQGEPTNSDGTGTGTGTGGTGSPGGEGEGTDMSETNDILRGIKSGILGESTDVTEATSAMATIQDAIGEGDGEDLDVNDIENPFGEVTETRTSGWLTDKLDNSGFLGGGACPADTTFTVGSSSHSISLAPICQVLSAVGSLVLSLAYLLAFRIVAGA